MTRDDVLAAGQVIGHLAGRMLVKVYDWTDDSSQPQQEEDTESLTTKQASQRFSVSPPTLRKLAREGKIRKIKHGSKLVRWPLKELMELFG